MKEMWYISDGEKPIAIFNSKKEAEQEFDIMGLGTSLRFRIVPALQEWEEDRNVREMLKMDHSFEAS